MAVAKMQLEDWLDDLCVRFIINLPQEDLSSVARICFQIEEAQWFYEDFVRPLDPTLPSMTLRSFSLRIFQHCPLLAPFSVENHTKAFEEFLQYKTRVPVRGAILLNEAMDSTVLVKGWKKGANWSFPRGKINKDEDDLECAIREVYEETGYDLRASGLVPEAEEVKSIEITMREQQMRLYVFRDVPMETYFQPRTRKEISKIQWYKLSELPAFRKKGAHNPNDVAAAVNANKFYMVAPFLVPLKKWVVQQKKKDAARAANHAHLNPHSLLEEPVTEDDVWTQTEPASDAANRIPALDTLEGATRELQRLLKVQPQAQGMQVPAPAEVDQDKGGALLAILQANSRAFQNAAPAHQELHTPLDHTITEVPQPHRPHHQHHPQQRAPLASYQPPPHFPIMPNTGYPSSNYYQGSATGAVQSYPGGYEQPIMMSPPYGLAQPPLRHPQPLPPQVQKSLLSRATAFGSTPPPKSTDEGPSQPATTNLTIHQSLNNQQSQTIVPHGKQRSTQLTSQSMALLDVLKSGSRPTVPTVSQPARQPVEQFSPAASLQAPSPAAPAYGQQPLYQPGAPAPWQQSAQPVPQPLADATVPRAGPPSDQHRSALLQMFKKVESSIPSSTEGVAQTANTNVINSVSHMQITQGLPSVSSNGYDLRASTGGDTHISTSFNSQLHIQSQSRRSDPASASLAQTHGQHAIENNTSHSQSTTGQHSATGVALPMHQTGILQRTENMGKNPVSRMSSLNPAVASPYSVIGQDKPASLATPPTASSFPTPAISQRKPEMSSEQRQKLLSLFGKPQSPSPGIALDDKGKGIELTLADKGPRSRVASLASGSGQILPDSLPESRRGSQTPISPADRSFLLGYLASVTNSATR